MPSLSTLQRRLAGLEQQVEALQRENARLKSGYSGVPLTLPPTVGQHRLPVFEHGRRPVFWADAEVRQFITEQHRRVTLKMAIAACRVRFGDERTPSRSAIHRYWSKLDDLARRAA